MSEVDQWTEDFTLLAINDGSKDQTLEILQRCQDQLGSRLEILDQPNQGHGQSCLAGYRLASERGYRYVLQIDTDGQCDPQFFYRLWNLRNRYEIIYGRRYQRLDGWRRTLASQILRWVVRGAAGVWCVDPNVPYRLMKTDRLRSKIEAIPKEFFLANVALAVLLKRDPSWREATIPIVFRERFGGEPTVRLNQFGTRAKELVRQLKRL